MQEIKLGVVEARFAEIIWKNEPLTSRELVALCEKELNWKRTTTYTVLKKLCNRGLFATKDSVIVSRISQSQFQASCSSAFVKEAFHGSLPAFLAAFTSAKALTAEEITEIRKMIDAYEENL